MKSKSIRILLTIISNLVLICDLYFAYYIFETVLWSDVLVGLGDPAANIFEFAWTWSDTLNLCVILGFTIGLFLLTYRLWIPKSKAADLSVIRKPITTSTSIVFIYDVFFVYYMLVEKSWPWEWPEEEIGENFPFVAYWSIEITILIILIAFNVGLGYLTYKAWWPKSPKTTASDIKPTSPVKNKNKK
jgi:hypothetical protein